MTPERRKELLDRPHTPFVDGDFTESELHWLLTRLAAMEKIVATLPKDADGETIYGGAVKWVLSESVPCEGKVMPCEGNLIKILLNDGYADVYQPSEIYASRESCERSMKGSK